MRARPLVGVALISIMGALAGCSSTDLRNRADQAERGADKIRQISDDLEAGRVTHDDLIQVIRSYVPSPLQDQADEVIRIADDAPAAGRDIASLLDNLALDLRRQADADQSSAANALNGTLALLAALLGGGGAAGVAGTLIGLFRGRKQGAEYVTAGVYKAASNDPAFRDAIKSGEAGETLSRHFQGTPKSVQKAVTKNLI